MPRPLGLGEFPNLASSFYSSVTDIYECGLAELLLPNGPSLLSTLLMVGLS